MRPSERGRPDSKMVFPAASVIVRNIHVLRGDYSEAESLYHVRASHVDATQRGWGRRDLVGILLHQGKFQEALRKLDLGIETDRIELGDCWPMVEKIDRRYSILVWFIEDYPAALAEVERLKTVVDKLDPYNQNEIQQYLWRGASIYAASGNPAKADSLMQQMVQTVDTTATRNLANNYLYYLAYVEYEKGNFDSAIALHDKIIGNPSFSNYLRDLGLYYLRAGRLGDAVSTLEECLGRYDHMNIGNPEWYVITHYWLGQAYEESGWTDKAIEQYETFLDIWKNADDGLKSVEDAKLRLVRLKSKS